MKLALACALLAGCVSPLAPLKWSPLPDLPAPASDPPGDVAVAVGPGSAVEEPAYLVSPELYFAFAARSDALYDVEQLLAREREEREADRAMASEAFKIAIEACRRRQRAACAVCAALGVVAGGLPGVGVAAGACR